MSDDQDPASTWASLRPDTKVAAVLSFGLWTVGILGEMLFVGYRSPEQGLGRWEAFGFASLGVIWLAWAAMRIAAVLRREEPWA